MSTFLHLGKRIVNVDHIVLVERVAAKKTGNSIHPAGVEVTLTAVELEPLDDYGEGPGRSAASVSQGFQVYGEQADKLWAWFALRADTMDLEGGAQ